MCVHSYTCFLALRTQKKYVIIQRDEIHQSTARKSCQGGLEAITMFVNVFGLICMLSHSRNLRKKVPDILLQSRIGPQWLKAAGTVKSTVHAKQGHCERHI